MTFITPAHGWNGVTITLSAGEYAHDTRAVNIGNGLLRLQWSGQVETTAGGPKDCLVTRGTSVFYRRYKHKPFYFVGLVVSKVDITETLPHPRPNYRVYRLIINRNFNVYGTLCSPRGASSHLKFKEAAIRRIHGIRHPRVTQQGVMRIL